MVLPGWNFGSQDLRLNKADSSQAYISQACKEEKVFMGGRKKLWLIIIGIIALLAVGALMVLPLYIALAIGGVAVLVVLFLSGSPSRRRWDAASKAEAEAAQRGDQAAFLGDRHDTTL